MAQTRELLELPDPDYNRSIARSRREIPGLYLEAKARTGAKADNLTYSVFLRDAKKIKDVNIIYTPSQQESSSTYEQMRQCAPESLTKKN